MASRYNNRDILKTSDGKPYYQGKIYPNIPLSENDRYVVTTIGDRLDYLAYNFYRDSELWWIIATANNNVTKGSLFPIPGTQLRIPANASDVINLFNQYNNTK
jgi:hypothetical protein